MLQLACVQVERRMMRYDDKLTIFLWCGCSCILWFDGLVTLNQTTMSQILRTNTFLAIAIASLLTTLHVAKIFERIGACSHCETELLLNERHYSYFNTESDKEVQKCRSIYWLDTLKANHSFQNSTADHFKPDTSAPSDKTWFTTHSNVLRYEWRFHSLNERRACMPKMSKK